MFTGIIQEIGTVSSVDLLPNPDGGLPSARLTIQGDQVLTDATAGCSIAVDGICLTVVEFTDSWFTADVMGETLSVTAMGDLAPGDRVNLERAVRADGRLDGHIVQGHVDATGTVTRRTPAERWEVFGFSVPAEAHRMIVHKGSIAVNGTSLTVSAVTEDGFEVSLIPTTLTGTTLGSLQVGDRVNLETDVLAKYVAAMMKERP